MTLRGQEIGPPLPCGFCGALPDIKQDRGAGKWALTHLKDDCPDGRWSHWGYDRPEGAVSRWNHYHRAGRVQIPELLTCECGAMPRVEMKFRPPMHRWVISCSDGAAGHQHVWGKKKHETAEDWNRLRTDGELTP